jgi:hypothetical protein
MGGLHFLHGYDDTGRRVEPRGGSAACGMICTTRRGWRGRSARGPWLDRGWTLRQTRQPSGVLSPCEDDRDPWRAVSSAAPRPRPRRRSSATDLKRRGVRGHAYKESVRRQSTRRAQAYRPGSSRRQRSKGSVRRKTRCCRHRSSWYPGGRQRRKGPHAQRTEPRGRDSRRSVPPSRARTSQQPESRAPSPMRVLPGWLSEIRVVLPPRQRTLRAAAKRPMPLLETA